MKKISLFLAVVILVILSIPLLASADNNYLNIKETTKLDGPC